MYVAKNAADQFVEEAIIDLLDHGSVDLVENARELETLRAAAECATAERKAFVKLASALDPDDFRAGYDQRRTHEAECWHTHDEAAASATDARELPTDGSAFKQLDLTARRRVARSLIDARRRLTAPVALQACADHRPLLHPLGPPSKEVSGLNAHEFRGASQAAPLGGSLRDIDVTDVPRNHHPDRCVSRGHAARVR